MISLEVNLAEIVLVEETGNQRQEVVRDVGARTVRRVFVDVDDREEVRGDPRLVAPICEGWSVSICTSRPRIL